MTLQIYVQHHQQAIKSYFSYLKEYTKTSNYRSAYNSLDKATDFKWKAEGSGFGVKLGTGIKLSVHLKKTNSFVTKTSKTSYRDEGKQIKFNENYLQIYRKVQTSVTIEGNSATLVDLSYYQSVPVGQGWNSSRLRQEDEDYLCHRFYGHVNCPIKGPTYTVQACPKSNPIMKWKGLKECLETCQGCRFQECVGDYIVIRNCERRIRNWAYEKCLKALGWMKGLDLS